MPFKVLIVDDEPDVEVLIRQRFRKQMKEGEFEFVFAQHGVAALECLRNDPALDVLMTNINMTVMDGLTLLANLPDMDRVMKAVIVSAYGDIQNIRAAMNKGAFDFLTKPIDFKDFEVTLQKTLDHARALKQAAQNRLQLAALQRELNIASEIQQSFLPRVFPDFPHRAALDLFALMLAARNVGGDFYDFYFLEPERLAIVIGDVSGKGIPAAIFMAMSRAVLKAVALTGMAPGECLHQVNASLCRDSGGELFVTLFYGILDLRTGELRYSKARKSVV